MASLEGQAVQDRYKDFLQVSNTNSGIDSTKRAVEDGEGTASKLELSTTVVNILSGFELNDVSAQTGSVLKHEVGGLEFDASAIADGGMFVGTASGTVAIRAGALTAGAAGFLTHEVGGLEIDISAITTDEIIVGQSSGVVAVRTPTQARVHLGLVYASQAEQETGTATDKVVSPGRQHHHQSAATGWALFNVSGVLDDSYNVTNVDDDGTGDFGVNWATDFSSSSFAFSVSVNSTSARISQANAVAAGSLEVKIFDSGGSGADPDGSARITCIAFGDQ